MTSNSDDYYQDGVVAYYNLNDDPSSDCSCDGCGKKCYSGFLCDGGCRREIVNSSDSSPNVDASFEEQAFYCKDCVAKFVETSEGKYICKSCENEFNNVCEDCGKIFLDEFALIGGTTYALQRWCGKCLTKKKSK